MSSVLSAAAVGAFAVPLGAGPASAAVAPCVDVLTSHLTVAAPAQAVAGDPVAVTVTAETALGRPDPTFSCTVHLGSSDPKAHLPADHTFTTGPGGDDGRYTFNGVTFATPGNQTVSAVDTTHPAKAGTSAPIVVSPPPPSGLAFTTAPVSGPAGTSPTLGPLTVQFQDASGNPDPLGTTTTVTLSSTSSGAVFSAYTAGAGCGTEPVTTVAVPAGSSSASFCYGDPNAGSPTVSAVSGSLRASQQESIQADVGAISGTVTDSGSPPQDLNGICVNVQPASGGGAGGSATTATDGTYTVSGLAPGSYDVEFSDCGTAGNYATQWYRGAASQASATPVAVATGQTTAGIDAAMAPAAEMSGTVTDTSSPPQPLGGICVQASPTSGGGGGYFAYTDSNGTYSMNGMPSGSYVVEFYAWCGNQGSYVTQWYKGASTQATATPVPVTAGQATTGIDAAMAPGGSISGTVTDTASPPNDLAGICVSAAPGQGGGAGGGSAVTAGDGTYTIKNLAPGSYEVEFVSCQGSGNYLPQWYSGASSPSSATPVPVTAGQTTTGIDAAMAPGGRITGTVTDSSSPPAPLGGICVSVAQVPGQPFYGYAAATTAADGTYTLAGLPTGSYDVRFTGCTPSADYVPQWYKGAYSQQAATAVSVTAGQATPGIDAVMVPGGSISGTVTDTASPPNSLFDVCVSASPTFAGGQYGSAYTSSDGSYTISGLTPGSYTVEFRNCGSGSYVTQWYQGASSSYSATPVSVSSGQTTSGIDAALAPGGQITGTVTDTASPPDKLGGICVNASGAGNYAYASTAPDGTYTVANLPAGSYTVEFSNGCGDSGSFLRQWYKGASSYSSATPVSVATGQTTSGIDAAMVPGGTIAGTVTDSASPPDGLAQMCVSATPTAGSGAGSGYASTAPDGSYSISGLAPGSYDVEFYDCGNPRRYLTQWYKGASTQAAATAVTVTSGQTTSGVDAAMVLGGTISGTVTDSSSPPQALAGICVYANPTQSGGPGGGYASTASDGTYTISGLPSGTYHVEFADCVPHPRYLAQWYQGASSDSSATPVSVTDGQTTPGIDAAMVLGGVISGTVTDTSSPAQDLAGMCVSVTPTSGSGSGAFAATASDGTYSVTGLATGSYDVEFYGGCPNRGNYLAQWYQGASTRSSATAVPVTAGQTTAGIDAAMAPGGIISGTVTDSSSPANPLSGICVAVVSTSGGGVGGSTATAADGTYSVNALPTGTYTVQFTTDCGNQGNYAPQWYQGATSSDSATPVPVTAGQTTAGIDAAMAPGGIISGTVTDSASPPDKLASICVSATPTGGGSPGPLGMAAYTGYTASDGTYSITRLPAGTYYVRFWNCGPPGTNYAPQWYQDASSQDTATQVSVSAGQTTSGIDAAMAPGGTISGTVTDTSSPAKPLGSICVIATPTSGGTGVSGGSGYTASDGTYAIADLAAGSYTVEFRNCGPSGSNYASQWYQGASSPGSSTPVTVTTGQTVSGIDAAMAPGGTISGTVTDSSSPPNALSGICVAAFPSGSASSGGYSEWRGVSSNDGSYTIPNLPTGSYDVEFSVGCGPAGPYATQWYQGASSQAGATPVPVTAGQNSPGVDAAMTS